MFGLRLLELALVVVVLAVLIGLLGWVVARSPLRRRTVERFAARQHLEITDGNAAHVVGALLITHRWRRAGLVLGLAVGLVWSLQYGSLTLHFLTGFLGWFVGAVVAEWRINGLDQPGPRRAAGLEPRSLTRYVTPVVLVVASVAAVILVVVGVAAVVRTGMTWDWVGWAAYSGAVMVVLAVTARAIVARPSGFVDSAVREADDALRCHGLTVLAGSGVAAAYPPIAGLAVMTAHPDGVPSSGGPAWTLLIMVVFVLLGLWVAVWSASARAVRDIPAGLPLDQVVEQSEEEAASP